MTRVAVTGATGFIGRHVVERLAVRGIEAVTKRVDIANPPSDPFDALGSPDVVIHLAWGGLPNYNSAHHLNEELPRHDAFLTALIDAGLKSLTVAGTCLEYGLKSGALDERLPTAPVNPYAQAKDSLRGRLQALQEQHAFDLTWARLFYLYGAGQPGTSLLPQLEAAISRGDVAFDMSGGEQLRDYLPVEVAADLLVTLALNGRDNGIVNVCSGEPIKVRALVDGEINRRGASIALNLGHFPYPEYEPMEFWGDDAKLRECVVRSLYRVDNLPIFQNRMHDTADDAVRSPRGTVELVEDLRTGLVYNRAFDESLMQYDEHYQNEQGVSAVFRAHLEQVAGIVESEMGRDKLVEVGCGKGYFLEMLAERGCDIQGFDPTYEGTNPRVTNRYFSRDVDVSGDGLILRHVLEHVENPVVFLQRLRDANGGRGLIYIEVPCLEWICERRAWFDVFYEHVNYFRLSDFSRMFDDVKVGGHLFGGQYLYVVASLASLRDPVYNPADPAPFPADFLDGVVANTHERGETYVWGGASKGVIFSLLRARQGSPVAGVVDINPAKQGKHLPATGLRVMSPAEFLARAPKGSRVFVMNSNYLDEIKAMSGNAYTYEEVA